MRRPAFALPTLLALGVLLPLAQTACRHPAVRPGAGTPLPPDDPRPRALLEELAQTAAARRAMRGTVRVSVDAPDWSYRATQRVAAERPARLRVEILGLFRQTAAVLTTDGRAYRFVEAGAGEAVVGPVTSDLLWQVARVDLAPGEAVRLLLGAARPGDALEPAAASVDASGAVTVSLDDRRGRRRQRFVFGPDGRLRLQENWNEAGEPTWDARFGDYRALEGGPFAGSLELHFARAGARARVEFRSFEINPELPAGVFSLEAPQRAARRGGRG